MFKYQWHDLLIVGDSFCAYRSNSYDWPQLVSLQLTGLEYSQNRLPRGQGFGGAAWWSTRRCLLDEIAKYRPRVIVICHTDPYRIPSDDNLSLNTNSVIENLNCIQVNGKIVTTTLPRKVGKAGVLYYNHLFSGNFHYWAQQQWFLELDRILVSQDIERVIHLFCFDGYFYQFSRGVSVRDVLINHALRSGGTNHFTEQVSSALAANLVTLINEYPGHGTEYPGSIM